MIKHRLDIGVRHALQIGEVADEAPMVEVKRPDDDLDLGVMTVNPSAAAHIVQEAVAVAKPDDFGDGEHSAQAFSTTPEALPPSGRRDTFLPCSRSLKSSAANVTTAS